MDLTGLKINLGAAAPDHHQTIETIFALEILDILDDLQGQFILVLPLFYMTTFQAFHIFLTKYGLPGTNPFQLGTDQVQKLLLQNSRANGGLITSLVVNIPAAKYQVVKTSQRHKVPDEGSPFLCALSQSNGSHLGQGTNWSGVIVFNGLHSGNKSGCHSTYARNQNSQLAFGFGNLSTFLNHVRLSPGSMDGEPNRNAQTREGSC